MSGYAYENNQLHLHFTYQRSLCQCSSTILANKCLVLTFPKAVRPPFMIVKKGEFLPLDQRLFIGMCNNTNIMYLPPSLYK